jgi:ABC-type transporter Mla subunit MlaD
MADAPVNTPEQLVQLANSIKDSITVGLNDRKTAIEQMLGSINAAIGAVADILEQLKTAIRNLLNVQATSIQERQRVEEQLRGLNTAHDDVKNALDALQAAYDQGIQQLEQTSGQLGQVPTDIENKIRQPIENLVGMASTPSGAAPEETGPQSGGRRKASKKSRRRHHTRKGGKKHSRKNKRGGYRWGARVSRKSKRS